MSDQEEKPRYWLGHTPDNKVEMLYAAEYDTPKEEAKELAKVIRRGLILRRITDRDGASRVWGCVISEAAMRKIAAAPEYDDDEGSAAQIAARLAGVES